MLDKIEAFRTIVSKEGGLNIDLAQPLNDATDQEMAKDRELI